MAIKGSIPAFDFKDYLEKKDYVGALAVLDSGQCDHLTNVDRLLWIAYCSFRLKHYNRSKDVYLELLSGMHEDAPLEIGLYIAIVHFYLGSYLDAEKAALSVLEDSELKHRILLHISRALGDETKVAKYRQYLRDSKQDALSAAAIELYRGRYKETADVYEMMIAQQRDDCALNVYLAECYFKMVCNLLRRAPVFQLVTSTEFHLTISSHRIATTYHLKHCQFIPGHFLIAPLQRMSRPVTCFVCAMLRLHWKY